MKKVLLGILAILSVQLFGKEKFHVNVRDQNGLPVKGATLMVQQKLPASGKWYWSSDKYERFFAETDENGKAEISFSARTRHFEWGVASDDYYSDTECSTVNEKFKVKENDDNTDYELVEHEMTRDVTLWKKRNPKAMYGYQDVIHNMTRVPKGSGRFGFDLKKLDWIPPYGSGEVADFYLVKDVRKTTECNETVGHLEFPDHCGYYKGQKNKNKLFPSVYEADTNAVYSSRLDFLYRHDKINKTVLREDIATDDEYIVLRTRVKCDESGKIVSANYSKILGRIVFGHYFVHNEIVFNQDANDNNLERDWKASAKKGLGFSGPMAP